ncbi:MAG: AmmeMemoRadiSam system radical SAM enzyme [Candidatus Methanomethylicia archaeon]
MFKVNPCVREALLYDKLDGEVRCKTCERFCIIPYGKNGFCRTRRNINGKLYTIIYGDISSLNANPIEKKPLFHFYPGSYALTVGSWSCNFTCPWCQNYMISKFPPDLRRSNYISPEDFVRMVGEYNCIGTSISFNEPTLLLEYSIDVFKLAKSHGYYNTFVTNGYMSFDALKLLCENGLDAVNVDIKGDGEAVEKYCDADVEKVWRNCIEFKRLGVHVEVTTLVIPGVNDDEDCLRSIASRIKRELGENTPWHITQYYPAYKALEYGLYAYRTPVEILEKAWRIGHEEGLNYVYIGNVPGHDKENTYCPKCSKLLIKRYVFTIVEYNLNADSTCPKCGEKIPIIGGYSGS